MLRAYIVMYKQSTNQNQNRKGMGKKKLILLLIIIFVNLAGYMFVHTEDRKSLHFEDILHSGI